MHIEGVQYVSGLSQVPQHQILDGRIPEEVRRAFGRLLLRFQRCTVRMDEGKHLLDQNFIETRSGTKLTIITDLLSFFQMFGQFFDVNHNSPEDIMTKTEFAKSVSASVSKFHSVASKKKTN